MECGGVKLNSRQMIAGVAAIFSLLYSLTGFAKTDQKTLCVWDIVGRNGEIFNLMMDFQIEALRWGVDIKPIVFTDERIAAEDFKAKRCEAVVLTGMRARAFNGFTGSLDSFGTLPSYEHLKVALQAFKHPKLATRMVKGPFEVIGVIPMGAAYFFVNDRTIDTPAELAGKKIAVLDHDESQLKMVSRVGGAPISVDVTTFAGKFNNGTIDVCGAPAEAYGILELYRGLDPNGGIIRFPVLQVTAQIITWREHFPEDFGRKSRAFFYDQFGIRLAQIKKAADNIDKKWWVDIPTEKNHHYLEIMREARLALRDDRIYDADAMRFLRKVRCKIDGANPECTERKE